VPLPALVDHQRELGALSIAFDDVAPVGDQPFGTTDAGW